MRGDCLVRLRGLADNSVDSVVTDPPYGLSDHAEKDIIACMTAWLAGKPYLHGKAGFMNRTWDSFVPGPEVWREVFRVLKPGGYVLCFASTRTDDLMSMALRLAGFRKHPFIGWCFGSGFPKAANLGKMFDKHGGQSVGWFGPWFRKWREDNGVTQKQVAALFPSKTGGLTGCVANWELGLNTPTPDQFNLIRDTFGLPFDSISETERKVVGRQRGSLLAVAPGQDNDRSSAVLEITAPATDAAREWDGWYYGLQSLKPAIEPCLMFQKPHEGRMTDNVQAFGTGAINIDGCRVGTTPDADAKGYADKCASVVGLSSNRNGAAYSEWSGERQDSASPMGRWPANLITDGSAEVVALFPNSAGAGGSVPNVKVTGYGSGIGTGESAYLGGERTKVDSGSGSAARFFKQCAPDAEDIECERLLYYPKASRKDRNEGLEDPGPQFEHGATLRKVENTATKGNTHPTVKNSALMRHLCRLVTPPGGVVLDPFTGSGSTGKAAMLEGFRFIGCELGAEYLAIAAARIRHAHGLANPDPAPADESEPEPQMSLFA